jgi:toxin ParE1/3/4
VKVVVSPAAEADLAGIHDFTYATWGETQAATYIDILVARFKWLAVNRPLWRARDDLLPGLFGRYEGRQLIVFRDGGDPVQIVRVLHQRMDPARHLQP